MSKAGRLIPKVPGVPGVPSIPDVAGRVAGRRAAYSASTKSALIDVAEELFTAQGYSSTSLDAIVSGAEVTKGALYHHFSGKQALFEAVFERVEQQGAAAIQASLVDEEDPWLKAQAGLRSFLAVVQQPAYRRIVVQDGPSVLGHERFREQEERSTFANVLEIVRAVLSAGTWDLEEDMLQTFTRIFFGAMSAAGDSVASSEDAQAAAERVETAIGFILAGLQGLVEAGVELPGPGA